MITKLLITMSNGAQFSVKSTLPFSEAVEDLFEGEGVMCKISDTIVLNTHHIAFIENITNDTTKGLSIKLGGGSKNRS